MWNEELRKEYSHDIYPRVFEFACCVVRLHRTLAKKSVNRIPASQLLRAGTSVGANLEEANAAHSHSDFVAKTRIALKEARESLYWLRLIEATDMAPLGDVHPLVIEANALVSILTTIVKNATKKPAAHS